MTRTERLLRLARERGDLLAVATLEGRNHAHPAKPGEITRAWLDAQARADNRAWTETELRALWGDR